MKNRGIILLNLKLLHTPVETLASLTDRSFLGNFSSDSIAMHERQMDRVFLCAYDCCLSACLLQCLKETMSFCLSFSLSWSKEKPALGTGFFGVMLQAKCSLILYVPSFTSRLLFCSASNPTLMSGSTWLCERTRIDVNQFQIAARPPLARRDARSALSSLIGGFSFR